MIHENGVIWIGDKETGRYGRRICRLPSIFDDQRGSLQRIFLILSKRGYAKNMGGYYLVDWLDVKENHYRMSWFNGMGDKSISMVNDLLDIIKNNFPDLINKHIL